MLKSINKRDSSLDLIKLISILMVVVLHVSSNGFTSTDARLWNGANFFESFTRSCVPLFFMVTGALLGNKDCTISTSLSRIKRVIIPLAFWSVAYIIFFRYVINSDVSLIRIISIPAAGHLWYLYSLIGVYITMPILCFIIKKADQSIKILLLILWFSSCILIPSMKGYGFIISPYFDFSTIGLYQGYFFCGAILSGVEKTKNTRIFFLILFLCMSLIIMFLTRKLFDEEGLHDVRNYLNSSIFVCLASISAFLSMYGIKFKSSITKRLLGIQSRYVFGIYLIHLSFVYLIGVLGFSVSSYNVYYFIPASSILIYVVSFFICHIIYKSNIRIILS